ncbi:AFG1-like ATPase [Alcanivorax jadensis T9]|jgi:cell division protein ZapE|uniref:Cell division protein ZapE n=1 Tax=Alcanivorax jadensis T9 TaxID=1177181 RepID=A0ABR4WBS8_9GAMM|nr:MULTISPECIES: cell division protein ZapE [Alcanivorax]KGD60853.1 AFG1-like ATPase [Alcanivorax jadensis T9]MAC15776.1 cell division protein ZapE [Alcanivorax sp.]MBG31822.1 cell division protein ZapE [Alcanivorax sp.]MBP21484.1 cell division protein ZapE [Alcanivorax sp.]|tara:strand:- start:385 stop:1467 length:1083 start_codon:yes stop_codon:yes gene_type:complete
MTPLEQYKADLQREDFFQDPAQERAVAELDELYHRLLAEPVGGGFLSRFRKPRTLTGLYMWGGVGRGKTYLMDVFFQALPFKEKRRMHFHRFMQKVHREMRERQGEKNPLVSIARKFASQARVLCFDEFFVTDITDAMILAGLMGELFANGVTLVATSNIEPDGLYKDGLQRARFLPAIELLKEYTKVLNVDGGNDYRLRLLEQAELYHCPLGKAADAFLRERFHTLEPDHSRHRDHGNVLIEGRKISSVMCADDVVWFEFKALCDGPRSQTDYIEVAREFHTVLVSNVEQMGAGKDDMARRFINLVDEFYDRAVKLVITAEVPIEDIYAGGRLDFEFERTRSRLQEMQSSEYLGLEHRA